MSANDTLIRRRVTACRAGTFEQAICRVHSGWVVLGDVLLELTSAVRINYEILGNLEPALHVHVFPRTASIRLASLPERIHSFRAGRGT